MMLWVKKIRLSCVSRESALEKAIIFATVIELFRNQPGVQSHDQALLFRFE